MQIDQTKFMNAIIEKTTTKLNQVQNQVTLLEIQLQFALEQNDLLAAELEKLKKKKEKTSEDYSIPN